MASLNTPPDPILTEHKNLIIDADGVPYVDQEQAARRKTGIRRQTRRSKKERQIIEQRIEHVRGMLAMQLTDRDVKRTCATLWGIHKRTVGRYIRVARRRNGEHLRLSPDDLRSNSREFWTKKLIEYRNMHAMANRELADAAKLIADGKALSEIGRVEKEKAETPEEHMLANETLANASRMIGAASTIETEAHGRIRYAMAKIEEVMDRIDKMVGNYKLTPEGEIPKSPELRIEEARLEMERKRLGQTTNIQINIGTKPDGTPIVLASQEDVDAEIRRLTAMETPKSPLIEAGVIDIDEAAVAIEKEIQNDVNISR